MNAVFKRISNNISYGHLHQRPKKTRNMTAQNEMKLCFTILPSLEISTEGPSKWLVKILYKIYAAKKKERKALASEDNNSE